MTQSQPPITRTTHTLPFDKLSPRDFEWLVQREGYERAEHPTALATRAIQRVAAGSGVLGWKQFVIPSLQLSITYTVAGIGGRNRGLITGYGSRGL